MGLDAGFYLGPYLLVADAEQIATRVYKSCLNKECIKHAVEVSACNFCSECGKEVSNYEKEFKKRMSIYDIFPIDDRLWELNHKVDGMHKDLRYFMANHHSPFNYNLDAESGGLLSITDGLKQSEHMDWFREYYKPEIKRLSELFGEDNVQLGYGVLVYYS